MWGMASFNVRATWSFTRQNDCFYDVISYYDVMMLWC